MKTLIKNLTIAVIIFAATLQSTISYSQTSGVKVSLRVLLGGPYNTTTGLMNDDLRAIGAIPFIEPYTIEYTKPVVGEPSGETVSSSVLAITGNNAIVDWIFLELRNPLYSGSLVATKRALLQCDGDIVSNEDGTSPVLFTGVAPGEYYVSVKHRNHTGVMTADAIHLADTTTVIDFINNPVWIKPGQTNPPRKTCGSIFVLWPGDAGHDKHVKYNGANSDKANILAALGGGPNTILENTYRPEDLNMDGKIKYNNADNDRAVVLSTVGLTTLNNIVSTHTPN